MKKLIFSAILIFFSLQIFAQNIPAAKKPFTSADLFKKSKNQKTAAWICLGGGFTLNATALIIILSNGASDLASLVVLQPKVHNYDGAAALSIIGAAAMAGSIPLFIASAKNKREANIMLKNEKAAIGIPIPSSKQIPGITLSIPLGR